MSDLTDAIEAAALAMYGTPRLAERNRDMAERAIIAANVEAFSVGGTTTSSENP